MATYDPPRPMWKRNVAAILDFVLAFLVFGYVLSKMPGNRPAPPPTMDAGTKTVELFGLGGWRALALIVLIVAYFIVLGRTGGTVTQKSACILSRISEHFVMCKEDR